MYKLLHHCALLGSHVREGGRDERRNLRPAGQRCEHLVRASFVGEGFMRIALVFLRFLRGRHVERRDYVSRCIAFFTRRLGREVYAPGALIVLPTDADADDGADSADGGVEMAGCCVYDHAITIVSMLLWTVP